MESVDRLQGMWEWSLGGCRGEFLRLWSYMQYSLNEANPI